MKKPEIPSDEGQRLKDLCDYGILDTDSEANFDKITALAAEIFGVPYSVVSFVDADRQWFKSRYGLSLIETPRDVSFCAHAILNEEIMVVTDALKDERFSGNPAVIGPPNIRFYAGAPLVTPTGHKLGTLCVFDTQPKTITDSQKNILLSLARHVMDILELRKKSAQVGSYAKIFQQSADSVLTFSPEEGKFSSANPSTLRLFNIDSLEHFLTLGPWDLSPEFQPDGESSESKAKKMIGLAMENGSAFFHWTHRKFMGKDMPCTVLLSRIDQGNSSYLQATIRDISADIESEKRHTMLLETMGEGLVILSDKGVTGYNSSALKILQLSADEILGRVSLPKGWEAIREDGSRFQLREHPAIVALKTGNIIPAIKMGVRLPDNEIRWITINSVPVDGREGRYVISTFSDITPLVRASEEHRFVLDVIGVGVWKVNLKTGEQIWDRKMYQLYGLDPQTFSIDYNSWKQLLTPESRASVDEGLSRILQGSDTFSSNLEIVKATGEKIILGSRGQVGRNKAGEPVMIYGINWDRTKEIELEKNLEIEKAKTLHTAKLASIGQLAAGVGHEINNPLAIVSGLITMTEHMLEAGANPSEISDKFRKMESSVIRISNIVKGLRTFARSDKNEVTEFDPFTMVSETVDFLKEIYVREGVIISLEQIKRPVAIKANRGRLEQVLVNLLSNAKDASVGKPERKINVFVTADSEELEIVVKDNGSGIRPEIREKIFEPFFTTKDVNLGTGIGLSLVNTIVKEHDGKIELNSEVGKGTEFSVKLPVKFRSGPASSGAAKKSSDEKINCRILIVDDEKELREVLTEILSYSCTEVISAETAEEGLSILRKGKTDLVLSDIKMPMMDGFEFLKVIRREPAISAVKFLFITGGIEMSAEELKIVSRDSDGVFHKPVKIPDLLHRIRQIIKA